MLLPEYHFIIVCFWLISVGFLTSLVMMFAIESPVDIEYNSCFWLVVLHGVAASATLIFTNASLTVLTSAEFSILTTSSVVELFIAQLTFLKDVRESSRNVFEFVGATLVVVACLLEPVYILCKQRFQATNKSDVTTQEDEKLLSEKLPLIENKNNK